MHSSLINQKYKTGTDCRLRHFLFPTNCLNSAIQMRRMKTILIERFGCPYGERIGLNTVFVNTLERAATALGRIGNY